MTTCPNCGHAWTQRRASRKPAGVLPEIMPTPERRELFAAWLTYRNGGIKPAGMRGATKGARDGYNTRKRHDDLYQWCSDAFYAGMLYDYTLPSGDTWEIVWEKGSPALTYSTEQLRGVLASWDRALIAA